MRVAYWWATAGVASQSIEDGVGASDACTIGADRAAATFSNWSEAAAGNTAHAGMGWDHDMRDAAPTAVIDNMRLGWLAWRTMQCKPVRGKEGYLFGNVACLRLFGLHLI